MAILLIWKAPDYFRWLNRHKILIIPVYILHKLVQEFSSKFKVSGLAYFWIKFKNIGDSLSFSQILIILLNFDFLINRLVSFTLWRCLFETLAFGSLPKIQRQWLLLDLVSSLLIKLKYHIFNTTTPVSPPSTEIFEWQVLIVLVFHMKV